MHDILEFQQASRSLAFRRRLETSQWDGKYSEILFLVVIQQLCGQSFAILGGELS